MVLYQFSPYICTLKRSHSLKLENVKSVSIISHSS